MNRKILVRGMLLLAALGVLAAVVYFYRALDARTAPEAANRLTLYGNVDIRQVSLAFNANERIAELMAREGDVVQAGQLLGRLDDRAARLRLAQVEAQIGAQAQALQRLRAGSRPEEVAQARANVAAAEAGAAYSARQAARLQATSDATAGQGVSLSDLDNARAQAQVAQAQAEATRKAAQLVQAGPRQEDIALAAQQLAGARADAALVRYQIEQASLLAPLAAVVRARLLEPGDMASPQRPVYTLALTAPKWVRAYVPETALGRLRTGMAATVSTDSQPDHAIAARLNYIASVAEFTPKTVQTPELRTSLVYELRFEVDDPKDVLRLGMPATVRLTLQP